MPETTLEQTIENLDGAPQEPNEEETQEPVTTTVEESEDPEPEEDEESADEEDDEPDEDPEESGEDAGDSTVIDAKVKEALKDNPEALRILERQEKGFAKAIEENRNLRQLTPLADIHNRLLDPATMPETIKDILERNAQAWNMSTQDLLDLAYGNAEDADPSQAENMRLATLERELAEMKRAQTEKAQADEERQYVERIARKTIKAAAQELNGFAVTEKMIAKAIRDNPQHRNDPLRAVKMAYVDQILAHKGRVATGLKAVGHTLPDSAKGRGGQVTSTTNLSLEKAIDLLADAS